MLIFETDKGQIQMKEKINRFSPAALFFIIWVFFAVCSVIFLLLTHGDRLDVLVFAGGMNRFMDFFNHISYVMRDGPGNVYSVSAHACFPPFIYIMFFLFGRIIPAGSTVMAETEATSPYALLLYIWYSVVVSAVLSYLISKLYKNRFSLLLTVMILTSNVYIFSVIERGNTAVLVFLLLAGVFLLRDNPRWYWRELALIFIAMAAGIKIYPAVFGILYLFEKRWAEAARLILYGILFFFGPFVFFGGFAGLHQFIENSLAVQISGASGFACLKSFITYFSDIRGLNISDTFLNLIVALYFLLALGAVYAAETMWKKTFLLCSIMILCPFWSGSYTHIYLALPLVLFVAGQDSKKKNAFHFTDYIYAVLFACTFSFFTLASNRVAYITGQDLPTLVRYLPIYIMNFLMLCEIYSIKIIPSFVSFMKRR